MRKIAFLYGVVTIVILFVSISHASMNTTGLVYENDERVFFTLNGTTDYTHTFDIGNDWETINRASVKIKLKDDSRSICDLLEYVSIFLDGDLKVYKDEVDSWEDRNLKEVYVLKNVSPYLDDRLLDVRLKWEDPECGDGDFWHINTKLCVSGTVAAPVPGAVWLLGSGMVVFLGIKRWFYN